MINSCQKSNCGYEIIKRNKTITKDNCKIPISFPEIRGLADKERMTKLNEIFEKIPDHEFYAKDCEQKGKSKVIGNYEILLQNDSILSIEFQTLIERQNKRIDTVYHTVVVNPKVKDTSKFGILGIEPNKIVTNFDRGKIYPYIKKYSTEKLKNQINLLAYEKGSNYEITWAVSEKDFIIYLGGEGEWFGKNKLKIPLDKLK